MIRSVLVAGLALILVWLSHPVALAQGGGIGVMPKQDEGEETRSWFLYTLSAGESISDTIVVTNHSSEKKFIQIEALDGLTTLSGNYSLVEDAGANQDLGTWVKLDASRIYVNPNTSQEVDFTVAVPEGASVGEHSGGIVIYEINPQTSGVNIKTRVGARMYVMVPGEVVRKITFEDVDYSLADGRLSFHIKAKNDSNVKLAPKLDIIVSSFLGRRVQSEEQKGMYIAGAQMEMEREWQGRAPRFGYYKVRLVLHTGSTEQTLADGTTSTLPDETFEYTLSFWVGANYLWWVLLGLIVAWLLFRGAVYISDLRKYRTRFEVYEAGARESLDKISERFGIMPAVIIKFNGLRWPHRTKKGEKLLIPKGFLTRSELKNKADVMPPVWKYLVTYQLSLYHPRII